MERKRVVLAAINAKYIHSNLAVYSLKANARAYADEVVLCEYTINHRKEEILADLYEQKADIIGFSCYLWNIEYITAVAEDLKKLCPSVQIFAGGPEVSYRPEDFLQENKCFDFVMVGEGEKTFAEFLDCVERDEGELAPVAGLVWRNGGEVVRNAPREALDMDELVFPYSSLKGMENRILYYESIRGCPFSCSYCLSSIEKAVRIKSMEKTFRELDFFLEKKVPQVKFVDRTFNCDHAHAYGVWQYLKEHDNGVTNFHFEIAADLLREEDFELFRGMRPGLVQFEAGVQSTNPDTIQAIRRVMALDTLAHSVKEIKKGKNIHVHLDLIAGLPHEGFDSFRKSFNDVYAMHPDQLQLGFLKLLDGSYMKERKTDYGMVNQTLPPYEIYATKWLSYEEIRALKQVEEMVEVYYNSFQFTAAMAYLEHFFPTAFDMYQSLGDYYKEHQLFEKKHSRAARYEILWNYAARVPGADREFLRETMTYDLYSRDYVKSPPAFVRQHTAEEKIIIRDFLEEALERGTLPEGYENLAVRQLFHMLYVDWFRLDMERLITSGEIREMKPYGLMFDYRHRSPLNHSAHMLPIRLQDAP